MQQLHISSSSSPAEKSAMSESVSDNERLLESIEVSGGFLSLGGGDHCGGICWVTILGSHYWLSIHWWDEMA